LIYNAPFYLGLEALPPVIAHGTEWIYVLGILPYLLFLRSAFRPNSVWATAFVAICTLLLFGGAVGASLNSGFSNSLDDPSYLIEWAGYTLPCFWMCSEGAIAYSAAKKRVSIGLCSPVVANRYLLFAGFGFFQIAACFADLSWAYGNSSEGATSAFAEGLLGATEIASIVVLWFAFFPPLVYRRWLDARATRLSNATRDA
jgi:hypothetical protein